MHTQPYSVPSATFYARIRERWADGISCPSDILFALGVSLLWLAFYNARFWEATFSAMWHPNSGALLFIASLFVLVLGAQAILIMLWPTRTAMRIATSVLFVIAALGSYFCDTYGAIMNKDMMRNVLQTDPAEALALLNPELLVHTLLLGVVPAVLIWRIKLPAKTLRAQLTQRAIFIGTTLLLCVACVFASSANYAVFFRAYKPIRFTLSPVAEIVSMASLVAGKRNETNAPLLDPAGKVERTSSAAAKPLVLFLVVGETARAANFQLGGYARATNPQLSGLSGLTYFEHTSSCGTSTAISVPCLFSHLPRTEFKVDEASRYTNLLDSLAQAGFDIEWRDNNAGCKGVCARVATIDYSSREAPDEVMFEGLQEKLQTLTRDTVIVFHQMGSHGPAYHERYPPAFAKFQPACESNQLQRCRPEEIVNAYDNTLLYTDHVLATQISLLRAAAGHVDSLLLYVSDHGESLGENGIYLHGMPYAFAPAAQKEVPMLLWVSEGYARRTQLQADCLQKAARLPVSHDLVYHSVLGAAEVRNQVYDRKLDLISGCRRGQAGGE